MNAHDDQHLAELERLVAQQKARIGDLEQACEQKDRQIAQLTSTVADKERQLKKSQQQCEELLRRLCGRRSERFSPDQPWFDELVGQALSQIPTDRKDDGAGEATPDDAALPAPAQPEGTGKRGKRHGRVPVPDWIERRIIEVDVPDEAKLDPETKQPLLVIGYEETVKLDVIPSRMVANVYRRPKYGPLERADGAMQIIIPRLPEFPLGSCKADVGLLADVIISKTCDSMPLYRQGQRSEREGLRLPRSTTDDWYVKTGADLLNPLYELQRNITQDHALLQVDASTLPVLQAKLGKTHSAAMWAWVGSEGREGGAGPPDIFFQYTHNQTKEHPQAFLALCKRLEYLQADAASVLDEFFTLSKAKEAGCLYHARRYFEKTLGNAPFEASYVLGEIKALALIERQIRDLDAPGRKAERQRRSKPILDALFEKIAQWAPQVLPGELLGKAITYWTNQKKALRQFLEDGRLDMSNNFCEREFRYLATGRHNWLFCASPRGALAYATHLTMVRNCAHRNINPLDYYPDILRRLPTQPRDRLVDLLPCNWEPASPWGTRIVMPPTRAITPLVQA